MPIEFACESCTKLLRVPDGSGGRSCRCPSCGILLGIPDPNAIEIVEVVGDTHMPDKLHIPCPKCRHQLVCAPDLVGTKGQCRNCKYIFTISTDPGNAEAAETETPSLVFTCPKCNQLFEGKEEMQGRRGKCHTCGEVFTIELTAARQPEIQTIEKATARPTSSAAAGRSAHAEKSEAPPIQLTCSSCQGTMEVPASSAGQTTACPYCQQLLPIPKAVASPRRPPPLAVTPRPLHRPSTEQAFHADLGTDLGDFGGADQQATNPSPYLANPYAATSVYDAPKQPSPKLGSLPSGRSPIIYIMPGVAMIFVAVIGLVYVAVLTIAVFFAFAEPNANQTRLIGAVAGIVLMAIVGIAILAGGINMVRLSSLKSARAAACIMCIPCTCYFLSVLVGIWAIWVLYGPQAKEDFYS